MGWRPQSCKQKTGNKLGPHDSSFRFVLGVGLSAGPAHRLDAGAHVAASRPAGAPEDCRFVRILHDRPHGTAAPLSADKRLVNR